MKLYLNAGHDLMLDAGACGNGLKEAEVVHRVAELLEEHLVNAGVEVVANVQDDDLGYVVNFANQSGADVFVSIHCNASTNKYARGTETFICPQSYTARPIANFVQAQIVNSLGTINRGVKEANFFVLTRTSMSAILVELAFISNSEDAELLRTQENEFAKAIARGLTDYAVWRNI